MSCAAADTSTGIDNVDEITCIRTLQERAAIAYQAARDARAEYDRAPSDGMRAIAIVQAQRGASLSRTARVMLGCADND